MMNKIILAIANKKSFLKLDFVMPSYLLSAL